MHAKWWVVAVVAVVLAHSQVPATGQGKSSSVPVVQPITVVAGTDRDRYSAGDSVKLSVSLENTSNATVYVDSRMFWGGRTGGLKVEVNDERGEPVPDKMLGDLPMPPPKEGDLSILIRLDSGFFYGTWLNFTVKDRFPKPGRYSIRVTYKSWLPKEMVARQLRDLPALWSDTPPITSAPVWVNVVR
jgi:hypothetical protein